MEVENLTESSIFPTFSIIIDDYLVRKKDEVDLCQSFLAMSFIIFTFLLSISFYMPSIRNSPEFVLLISTVGLIFIMATIFAIRNYRTMKSQNPATEKFDKYIEDLLINNNSPIAYEVEDDLLRQYIKFRKLIREM